MNAEPRPIVVVASSNRGKATELAALLGEARVQLAPLPDEGIALLPEEGDDYAANAREKACAVAAALGELALADDSGLEVDALGGAPGPRSARWGGEGLDDVDRTRLLLQELRNVPAERRGARFVCYAALAAPEGDALVVVGECAGRILGAPRGESGFGYDPVFQPRGEDRSLAELTSEEKNRISHRGVALRSLMSELESWLARRRT